MNRGDVDSYLADGCGRCTHYRTPGCKVHLWTGPLVALRALVLESGLSESLKWGSPCYDLEGHNVLMLVAMRDRCAVSFIQGALLPDPEGLLSRSGPNVQAARELRFTTAEEVHARRDDLRRFVDAAIALRRQGAKVTFAPAPEPVPEELGEVLDADPARRAAFEALTPGRRRSFVLYVSGAKRRQTRTARAEACLPKILAGKGFHDR